MATILIVEDNRNLAKTIERSVNQDGHHQCRLAYTGLEAVEIFRQVRPEIVILDWMLPDIDGLDVCERIREANLRNNILPPGIIMLTAKSEGVDKAASFSAGADAYITKPFEPDALVGQVRALLRRLRGVVEARQAQMVRTPHFLINREQQQVQKWQPHSDSWKPLSLTPLEIAVLAVLASRPGRVWSRSELLDHAWDDGSDRDDRAVDSCIKRLRSKINSPEDDSDRFIQGVPSVGYRFKDTDDA